MYKRVVHELLRGFTDTEKYGFINYIELIASRNAVFYDMLNDNKTNRFILNDKNECIYQFIEYLYGKRRIVRLQELIKQNGKFGLQNIKLAEDIFEGRVESSKIEKAWAVSYLGDIELATNTDVMRCRDKMKKLIVLDRDIIKILDFYFYENSLFYIEGMGLEKDKFLEVLSAWDREENLNKGGFVAAFRDDEDIGDMIDRKGWYVAPVREEGIILFSNYVPIKDGGVIKQNISRKMMI